MRSFLAGALVAVGLLLVPLADLGAWTQRTIVSTDGFTDLATDVLRERDVRQALADRLADELERREPRLRTGRPVLVAGVRAASGTALFEQVFRTAVGGMHEQLRRGDDELSLDLDPALPVVRTQVALVDAQLADLIPDAADLPAITVVTRQEAPQVWDVVKLVRRAALAFPLFALAFLVAAVVMARRRGVMLAVVGVGIVVMAVLIIAALQLGQDPLSDVAGSQVSIEAFDAGYGVVAGSIVRQTVLFAALGALAGAGGLAGIIWYQRNRRPTGWA